MGMEVILVCATELRFNCYAAIWYKDIYTV